MSSHDPRALSNWARWSFVLYAAALPVAIAPMNVALALCGAMTLLLGFTRSGPRWVRTPVDLPALAWLAAMGVATLFASDRGRSAATLGKGLIPLLTALAAWHATDRRAGAAAVAALLATGSLAALMGCMRFLAAGARFPARAVGFSGTWMTFGLQMTLIASLAVGIAMTTRSRAWRIGSLAAAAAAITGLAASFTRSAWLGFAAALALMLGRRRLRALLVLAIACGAAYLLMPGEYGDRLRSAFDPWHPANRERAMMWASGVRIFRDHPWIGVGLHLRPILEAYRVPTATEHPTHLHDSFLQAAVTTGTLGLVAFLALCAALLRAAGAGFSGLRSAYGLGAGVRLGVTAGTLGFLAGSLFDHAFGDEPLTYMLFTLVGIAWAARGWEDGVPSAPAPAARGTPTPGPAGGDRGSGSG